MRASKREEVYVCVSVCGVCMCVCVYTGTENTIKNMNSVG